jgi:hypothetical protein
MILKILNKKLEFNILHFNELESLEGNKNFNSIIALVSGYNLFF